MRFGFRHQVHGDKPVTATGSSSTPSSASSFDTGFNELCEAAEEQRIARSNEALLRWLQQFGKGYEDAA